MSARQDDELERYMRGDSEVSSAYQRTSQLAPPRTLDRRMLERARAARRSAPHRDGLAYAACALLALAVLFTIQFAPGAINRLDDAPQFVQTAMHGDGSTDLRLRDAVLGGPHRTARAWLAHIAALRRAGQETQADAEYRRFLAAHPGYDANRRRSDQADQ